MWQSFMAYLTSPRFNTDLLKLLIFQYILLVFAFGMIGNYPKVIYFVGAIILTFGILLM